MRRIQKIEYAVSVIVKIKSDFYSENRYAAYELECAVSNFNYQKLIKFIKFKCAVLTKVNAPYFRYVSKFKNF